MTMARLRRSNLLLPRASAGVGAKVAWPWPKKVYAVTDKRIRTVLGMANKVQVVIDKRIEMIMDMVQAVVNKRTRMILAMDKRVHRDDHGYG
jgi:hypothetical protein